MSYIQEHIEYYREKQQRQKTQINHPDYYNQGIEAIDFIDSHNLNFSRGNAVKYIVRAGLKGGETEQEALEKAVWYLKREIKRLNLEEEERREKVLRTAMNDTEIIF